MCIVDAGGKTEAKGSAASAGVKLKTPVGNATAQTSVGSVTVKDGKVTASAVSSTASAQLGTSKEVRDGNTSATVNSNTNNNGEVSVGGKFGFFGLAVALNPVNLAKGLVDAVGALVEYVKNRADESVPLAPSNRNQFKKPD